MPTYATERDAETVVWNASQTVQTAQFHIKKVTMAFSVFLSFWKGANPEQTIKYFGFPQNHKLF